MGCVGAVGGRDGVLGCGVLGQRGVGTVGSAVAHSLRKL